MIWLFLLLVKYYNKLFYNFQIVDGTFHKEPVYYAKTLEQNFELISEKSGKYFICLGCNSASRISLKSGKICIKSASNR